ncbi:MAG: universal stress protein [Gemmatimonadota bacterium]
MRLLTLNSVLVATDLGETSFPAIRTAARLAPLAGAGLHLMHVAADRSGDGENQLAEHFRRAVPDAADPASVRVVRGPPAAMIVEYANQLGADVVILGPHRRLTATGPLGSTATNVVRTAPCPCLVASTELRLPLERVLVPVDISDVASAALSLALSWASALRSPGGSADLVALHVSQKPDPRSEHDRVHGEVGRARELARGAAHVVFSEQLVYGSDPAKEILRHAASMSADLVVMGTRGTGGTSSELGSVADAVVRDTPCPLLLVPPAVSQRRNDVSG